MKFKSGCVGLLLFGMCLTSVWAAELQTPDKVKDGLRMLAYVQNDMERKLTSKTYERLPHENEEFQEAAAPMLAAVASEPAAFKTKVEVAVKKAQADANAVSDVSASKDAAKIKTAIDAVAADLKTLNELFPEELRPVPGQLGSGPGMGAGGPPPGLR